MRIFDSVNFSNVSGFVISREKLKSIFFVLILFPVMMHVYAQNFPILYWNNIGVGVGMLFIAILMLGVRAGNGKEFVVFFVPFVICLMINAVFYNHENLKYFGKYLGFIAVYFLLLKSHFAEEKYYALYVKIVTYLFVLMFLIYLLCLITPVHLNFPVGELMLPANSSILTRHDFAFFMPYYMLVFPTLSHAGNGFDPSIFGIPRFCGYSAEPSAYAATILPAIYIACQLKMKKHMYVLIFALLLASSYGAISIFGLTLFVMWHFSRKISRPLAMVFLFVLFCFAIVFVVYGVYHFANNPAASDRLRSYSEMVNLTFSYFSLGFSWVSGNVNIIPKNAHALSAYFQVFINYGFAALLGYLIFLVLPLLKAYKSHKPIIYGFATCLILMAIKASEPMSLLFLFFLSFLNCKSIYYKRDTPTISDLYNLSLKS